jgi:hypothetical protein
MSAFDLSQFNNINNMLYFKLHNSPTFQYEEKTGMSYTIWCLNKYEQRAEQPCLYGPDEVVITYVYWHNNECEFGPIVVMGHEYDKDIIPCWFDATSYHKYDMDSDYDDER